MSSPKVGDRLHMRTIFTQPLGWEKDHQLKFVLQWGVGRITIHGAFRLPCHRRARAKGQLFGALSWKQGRPRWA